MIDFKKEVQQIAQAIFDKKGFNIIALDVRGVSTITEYLIIAEGTVERHTMALAGQVRDCVEKIANLEIFHTEGEAQGDWIVMDLGEIMVHLFIPELREKYRLEELWKEGKVLQLNLNKERVS